MQLPRLAIKNAQFTLTIALLLVLVGLVSYFNMPRSEDPQFDLPIVFIDVVYPGASPTDIESLVIDLLEDEVSDIDNIKEIESEIRDGAARITIDFIYGTDAEAALNKVKQAVSSVEPNLPSGIQALEVIKATPTSVAIMQVALWSDPTDYKTMEFYAKQLEKRIETIGSVRKADIWGVPLQIIAIDVNLALLKHYGLSVTAINQVLSGRATNITPGFVDANTRRFNVKASGNFTKIEEVADTVVLANDNFVLRLKDVASVSFSQLEPTYLTYMHDKPVIFLTVEQRAHRNIFALTTKINDVIADYQTSIPDNIHIEQLFQQADSVEVRVNGFFINLAQGLVIVGLMAVIFLGFRESLVVIISIPLAFIVAISWLDFAQFGLQQMSIVGLIIALGLLVDDAIVVTESIQREKNTADNMKSAAIIGTKKIAWATTSGTITTMLAFLPMLMLNSSTGDFIRSMPVTVVLVLLASLLISLTLLPLLASKLFTTRPPKIRALQHYINIFAATVYTRLLKKLINGRIALIVLSILLLVFMLSLFKDVGVSLFPKAEKPMILLEVETPVNSSLHATDAVMQQMSKALAKYEMIEKIALNVGNSNPRIYYNEIPKRGMARFGQVLIVLKNYQSTEVNALVKQLRAEFGQWRQAKIIVKEFTQGPVTDQPITIRLMSESLNDLTQVANDLTEKMQATQGIVNLNNPIGNANTELAMVIDYDKAGLSSVNINQLDSTLKTLLSGANVGAFKDDNGESYPVVVRRKNIDVEGLSDIDIQNTKGQAIPLQQLVSMELKKGRTDFFHYQKLRMARVSADVAQGYSINKLTAEMVSFLQKYDLPKGMYFTLGGEEESRQESFSGLTQIMLITAISIFAILVLQFRSILQPLIIFTSIPFAMAGAVVGLYLAGLSFSMMAFIGLISLFGIVVNNAIILIDSVNGYLAEGANKHDAILQASATRFTPILLTTLTTVGGLIPLTLFGGDLWQPLGVVIISGLCVSALASFLIVPVLTAIFTKKAQVSE